MRFQQDSYRVPEGPVRFLSSSHQVPIRFVSGSKRVLWVQMVGRKGGIRFPSGSALVSEKWFDPVKHLICGCMVTARFQQDKYTYSGITTNF